MIVKICDRCGRVIEKGEVRYVAKIELYAANDPLEVTGEGLEKDQLQEMDRLIKQCEAMTEEELLREVYTRFELDLCVRCQKSVAANPWLIIRSV